MVFDFFLINIYFLEFDKVEGGSEEYFWIQNSKYSYKARISRQISYQSPLMIYSQSNKIMVLIKKMIDAC